MCGQLSATYSAKYSLTGCNRPTAEVDEPLRRSTPGAITADVVRDCTRVDEVIFLGARIPLRRINGEIVVDAEYIPLKTVINKACHQRKSTCSGRRSLELMLGVVSRRFRSLMLELVRATSLDHIIDEVREGNVSIKN